MTSAGIPLAVNNRLAHERLAGEDAQVLGFLFQSAAVLELDLNRGRPANCVTPLVFFKQLSFGRHFFYFAEPREIAPLE